MSEVVTEFFVQGMICGSCTTTGVKALSDVPGLESAEFDFKAGTGRVVGNVDPQTICQLLTEAGYPAVVKSA